MYDLAPTYLSLCLSPTKIFPGSGSLVFFFKKKKNHLFSYVGLSRGMQGLSCVIRGLPLQALDSLAVASWALQGQHVGLVTLQYVGSWASLAAQQ